MSALYASPVMNLLCEKSAIYQYHIIISLYLWHIFMSLSTLDYTVDAWLIQLLCNLHISASDCFELARLAYLESDYYHTILWMNEALNRLNTDDDLTDSSHAAILDYLAYATYMVCIST